MLLVPRDGRVHMRSDSIGPPGSQKTLANQIASHGQRVSAVQVCQVRDKLWTRATSTAKWPTHTHTPTGLRWNQSLISFNNEKTPQGCELRFIAVLLCTFYFKNKCKCVKSAINSEQGQQARSNDPPTLTHQEDDAGTNLWSVLIMKKHPKGVNCDLSQYFVHVLF